MTRAIKFRAWNGGRMNYMPSLDVYTYPPDGIESYGRGVDGKQPLMQFTGLFDSKGKEIWEGDVVEISRKLTEKSEMKPIHEVVTFEDGAFYPRSHGEVFEVIGNVFENPPLIKTL